MNHERRGTRFSAGHSSRRPRRGQETGAAGRHERGEVRDHEERDGEPEDEHDGHGRIRERADVVREARNTTEPASRPIGMPSTSGAALSTLACQRTARESHRPFAPSAFRTARSRRRAWMETSSVWTIARAASAASSAVRMAGTFRTRAMLTIDEGGSSVPGCSPMRSPRRLAVPGGVPGRRSTAAALVSGVWVDAGESFVRHHAPQAHAVVGADRRYDGEADDAVGGMPVRSGEGELVTHTAAELLGGDPAQSQLVGTRRQPPGEDVGREITLDSVPRPPGRWSCPRRGPRRRSAP